MEHALFLIKLIACSGVGLWYQLALKNDAFTETASRGKVPYQGWAEFFYRDRKRIISTALAILFVTLAAGNLLNAANIGIKGTVKFFWGFFDVPKSFLYESFLCVMFGTVGYAGMDIVLRIFSRTKEKINDEIDKKTT